MKLMYKLTIIIMSVFLIGGLVYTAGSTAYANGVTPKPESSNKDSQPEQKADDTVNKDKGKQYITYEEIIAESDFQLVVQISQKEKINALYSTKEADKKVKELKKKAKDKQKLEDYLFYIEVDSKDNKQLVEATNWAITNKMTLIELQLVNELPASLIANLERAYNQNILIVSSTPVKLPFTLWNKVLRILDEEDYAKIDPALLHKVEGTSYNPKDKIVRTLLKPKTLSYSDLVRYLLPGRKAMTTAEMNNIILASSISVKDDYLFGKISISRIALITGIVNQYEWEILNKKGIDHPIGINLKKDNKALRRETKLPTITTEINPSNIYVFNVDYTNTEKETHFVQLYNLSTEKWEVIFETNDGVTTNHMTMPLEYEQDYAFRILFYLDDWHFQEVKFKTPKKEPVINVKETETTIKYEIDLLPDEIVNPKMEVVYDPSRLYVSETHRIQKSADGRFTFLYDAFDRLYKIMNSDNLVLIEYNYDIDGNIVRVTKQLIEL